MALEKSRKIEFVSIGISLAIHLCFAFIVFVLRSGPSDPFISVKVFYFDPITKMPVASRVDAHKKSVRKIVNTNRKIKMRPIESTAVVSRPHAPAGVEDTESPAPGAFVNTVPGALIAFPQVHYPVRCREHGIDGVVEFHLRYRDGTLEMAKVLKEVDDCPEFTNSALAAIREGQVIVKQYFVGKTINLRIPFRFQFKT
jgi:hypothetical protein